MATKLRAIVSGNMTRHRKASDIEVTITSPKDKVRCILKSLETYLRVFGLYCEACNFKKTESRKRLLRVAISVSNINSFVFFVCAWSNEIRLVPMLLEDWEHSYKMMLILLMILTYVCSSWGFTCLMLLNHKHYPAISRSLEFITTVPTFPLVLQQFALFVNLCIAISVIFPIYSLLSVFQEDRHEPTLMTRIRLAPSEPRTTIREVLKYVYAYFTILAFIHAVLYSVFLSVVCYILKREFEDICERLQTLAADGDDSWKDGEVERLRLQHDKVCQATRTADRVISYLVFGIFLAATLLVCFCISCLIHGFYPSEGIPILIAFSVSTFGQAVITTVYGVMLNHQVRVQMVERLLIL